MATKEMLCERKETLENMNEVCKLDLYCDRKTE